MKARQFSVPFLIGLAACVLVNFAIAHLAISAYFPARLADSGIPIPTATRVLMSRVTLVILELFGIASLGLGVRSIARRERRLGLRLVIASLIIGLLSGGSLF